MPETRHEKNVPAERHQAKANPRVSRPDGHEGRATCAERAPRQGPEAVDRLTVRSHLPIREGFPRAARLLRRADFEAVLARAAVRLRSPPLRLAAKRNPLGAARLGLVAPKRALPRAVDRNHAKRALRESFRRARAGLPPWDIVVRVDGVKDVAGAAEKLWAALK